MGIKKGGIMENWKDYEKSSDTKFDNISARNDQGSSLKFKQKLETVFKTKK